MSSYGHLWQQHDGEEGVWNSWGQRSWMNTFHLSGAPPIRLRVKGVSFYTDTPNSLLMSQFLFWDKLRADNQIHKPWILAEIDKS